MDDAEQPPAEREPESAERLSIRTIAEQFLAGNLARKNEKTFHEGDTSKMWRLYEGEADVPNIGKALLRVDYRQYDDKKSPAFDQVRFDYVGLHPGENGTHPLIAEMHWNKDIGPSENPYPYDLMLAHRFVIPQGERGGGIGTSLYKRAEAFAQEVADAKGEKLVLAQSTDQPLTMDWLEKRGYRPYPEEMEKRKEVLEHFERFTPVKVKDAKGHVRNESIDKDGKAFRIWFTKTLYPKQKSEKGVH